MEQTQNHKLGYLLKNLKTHYVDFEPSYHFLNCNYQDEYQEALKILETNN
jgi:molybdopterin-guanine dinucleotide biosynthesis protein A